MTLEVKDETTGFQVLVKRPDGTLVETLNWYGGKAGESPSTHPFVDPTTGKKYAVFGPYHDFGEGWALYELTEVARCC